MTFVEGEVVDLNVGDAYVAVKINSVRPENTYGVERDGSFLPLELRVSTQVTRRDGIVALMTVNPAENKRLILLGDKVKNYTPPPTPVPTPQMTPAPARRSFDFARNEPGAANPPTAVAGGGFSAGPSSPWGGTAQAYAPRAGAGWPGAPANAAAGGANPFGGGAGGGFGQPAAPAGGGNPFGGGAAAVPAAAGMNPFGGAASSDVPPVAPGGANPFGGPGAPAPGGVSNPFGAIPPGSPPAGPAAPAAGMNPFGGAAPASPSGGANPFGDGAAAPPAGQPAAANPFALGSSVQGTQP